MNEHDSERQHGRALPADQGAHLSRRRWLQTVGVAAVSLLAEGCLPQSESNAPARTTATERQPVAARVAIGQAASYDSSLVRQQVRALLDRIGGLDDLVARGPRVAIKVNLTGGTNSKPVAGVSPIESFVTHPEVVRALGEALREAGARELFIVEAVYERASYTQWGYDEIAKALGATLIDLNDPHPYSAFARVPVGPNAFIYQDFMLHPLLQEVDSFISVAKIKCHQIGGVTLSMKNLFGIAPLQLYRRDPKDTYRSAFHGDAEETGKRVPRIIIDLNRARPIQLSLLDGIKTVEAGEGPWIETMQPIAPGLLIAGKQALATDAVAAAVMGFNPRGDYPATPFLHGDNHLNLAAELELGTNDLNEIEVVGARIDEVRQQFKPVS
ncbi:MAG TPA: DUF362 domain-containing protein [Roseiflexaceae bacterium]|nr:DUF362 domain-containing protein [Roseiflexaceae bacterium]